MSQRFGYRDPAAPAATASEGRSLSSAGMGANARRLTDARDPAAALH